MPLIIPPPPRPRHYLLTPLSAAAHRPFNIIEQRRGTRCICTRRAERVRTAASPGLPPTVNTVWGGLLVCVREGMDLRENDRPHQPVERRATVIPSLLRKHVSLSLCSWCSFGFLSPPFLQISPPPPATKSPPAKRPLRQLPTPLRLRPPSEKLETVPRGNKAASESSEQVKQHVLSIPRSLTASPESDTSPPTVQYLQ